MARTLADAERDYDRALADGATAVSIMQVKLERQRREHLRTLAAVVFACGGKLEVGLSDLEYDPVVTIWSNPATGGFTIQARREQAFATPSEPAASIEGK